MTAPALRRRSLLALAAVPALARPARAATRLRIGILHTLSPAPLYIAMDRGYFRDAGLDAAFRFFQAAQPIAAAAVAGDIDVGVTALTGGFFALAGRGALRVIGGGLHEEKGVQGTALLASDRAFAAGLTTPAKAARPQRRHHPVRLLVPVHGRPHRRGRAFRSEKRHAAAVAGHRQHDRGGRHQPDRRDLRDRLAGEAAGAAGPRASARLGGRSVSLSAHRGLHDRTHDRPARGGAARLRAGLQARRERVSCGVLPRQRRTVRRCAMRKPTPRSPASRSSSSPATRTRGRKSSRGFRYYNADGALDVADVRRQIAWFKAQGLVKVPVDPTKVIDTSFLPALKT